MGCNNKYSTTYYIINSTFSAFSVLAIIGVSVLFVLSKNTRKNPSYRYIFYLLMADLIIAIGGFIPPSSDTACQIIGLFREYAILSSFMWTSGFTLLVINLLKNEKLAIVKYEKKALICCYGLPILIALPLIEYYGNSGFYCWISTSGNNQLNDTELTWLAFFSELIIGTIFMVYGIAKSYSLIKHHRYSTSTLKLFYRMLYYPLILIVVNVVGLMDRALQLQYPNDCMLFLKLLHIMTIQTQGFFNCLCFCLNSSIREEIISLLTRRRDSYDKTSLLENSYVEYDDDLDVNTTPQNLNVNQDLPRGLVHKFTSNEEKIN